MKSNSSFNYWKSTEVSELLFELYARAFRYNPHCFEILCYPLSTKCCLVIKVNLFYTKNPAEQKVVLWHTKDYESLSDLSYYNIHTLHL